MDTDTIIDSLMEELAAIEHARWSRWQTYMHSKGARLSDGSLVIPAELVERWDRQAATTYELLSDLEKEIDREQVQEYLPIIKEALRS